MSKKQWLNPALKNLGVNRTNEEIMTLDEPDLLARPEYKCLGNNGNNFQCPRAAIWVNWNGNLKMFDCGFYGKNGHLCNHIAQS